MINSERGDQYKIIRIDTDSMTKTGHMVKISLIIEIIRILEVEATLKIIKLQVKEDILGIERGHMTETEAGLEIIGEDVGGIEDLGI